MFPELFRIGEFVIHSYGFFIAVGAYLSFKYLSKKLKDELDIKEDEVVQLFLYLIASVFIGGKFFYYLEDVQKYIASPSLMFENFGNGFVFYGSLIFSVPTMLWYFKKKKWPIWQILDQMAITACIVHSFGRIGCLMAGCCHGMPTTMPWGIVFSDPTCAANPLNVPLHPTQLYEIFMIAVIGLIIYLNFKRKKNHGQWFLVYLILYSIGRSIIEVFRGDEARGFIVNGWISHSQGISIVIITLSFITLFIRHRNKNNQINID